MDNQTTAKEEMDRHLKEAMEDLSSLREWVDYMGQQIAKGKDGAVNAFLVTTLMERVTPVVYNLGMANGACLVSHKR